MQVTAVRDKIKSLMRFEKHIITSVVVVFACSFFLAVIGERIYTLGRNNLLEVIFSSASQSGSLDFIIEYSMMSFVRIIFLFIIAFFLLTHFVVKISDFYSFIYKYRYAIAGIVFLALVAGKIHFSSVSMYDYYTQTGFGSEFANPIFGIPRGIRSDEWLVVTPVQLAAQYPPDAYGVYNQLVRGAETLNLAHFGMHISFATLAFPLHIFFLFGAEYGISAIWVGTLIVTFMVSFEFAYIISRKNKLLAFTGACLITFSPFFQWWSHVPFVMTGLGTIVCFYYFINSDTKLKRILFAFGVATFFLQFTIGNIYPAWQVPAAYLYLGIATWIIATNWEKIKKFKIFDWSIFGAMLLLIAAVIVVFFIESREYISIISNTVYPGDRRDFGGGSFTYTVNRMMNGGVFAPLSSFMAFIGVNVCEFGGIYTLFPIPILFTIYTMIRKRITDSFSLILIGISLFFGTYILIGLPAWLANFTFLSLSTTSRAMDVLTFIQVFILIRTMSIFKAEIDEHDKRIKVGILLGAVITGALLTYTAIFFHTRTFVNPINYIYCTIHFIGFTVISYCIYDYQKCKHIFKSACIYMIVLSSVTWMSIHPIMSGLDAIKSKPLSIKVSELAVNTDEKWISLGGLVDQSFLIASGASTINSVNTYPNLDLWHKFDPNREYEFVYNRFAHVVADLTTDKTSFTLHTSDVIILNLSYDDLAIAGVKYIHIKGSLENHESLGLSLIYDEGGERIYSVEEYR